MAPKIGIIGFGVAGKAIVECVIKQWNSLPFTHFSGVPSIAVWDQRKITESEKFPFASVDITYYSISDCSLEEFIEQMEYVIPSPSIDMRPFKTMHKKIISELDIFSLFCKKPTIAITGSIGKTSTRTLLASLIAQLPFNGDGEQSYRLKPLEAGNIGSGLLGSIEHLSSHDIVVLELSSFQLENSYIFAPDIALITNLHPNHLDRHSTITDYLEAKLNLILSQQSHQTAFLHTSLLISPFHETTVRYLQKSASKKGFIHPAPFDETIVELVKPWSDTLFFMNNEGCSLWYQGTLSQLTSWNVFPESTYRENWLSIMSVLYTLGYDLSLLSMLPTLQLNLEPHRLESCGTINGIVCYNDSKATIIEATHAALTKLSFNQKPIILIVGGVNHAGNRAILAQRLENFPLLKKVVCFGNECSFFPSAHVCTTLDAAFETALAYAQAGDQILFSPNGAGTDFFVNYVERGNAFKKLVQTYEQKNLSS